MHGLLYDYVFYDCLLHPSTHLANVLLVVNQTVNQINVIQIELSLKIRPRWNIRLTCQAALTVTNCNLRYHQSGHYKLVFIVLNVTGQSQQGTLR